MQSTLRNSLTGNQAVKSSPIVYESPHSKVLVPLRPPRLCVEKGNLNCGFKDDSPLQTHREFRDSQIDESEVTEGMPKLALLQSRTFENKSVAFDHHEKLIRRAAAEGAQIIATQELFLTSYFCTVQDTGRFDLADRIPGPVTDRLGSLAAELGVVIVASLFEHRGPGLYHNTATIHDADGQMLGVYRKAHIPQDPGFEEKFYFTPGDSGWPVWDTAFGKIGVLVCWDQWYPEAARLMALGGAELLIYPTAIGWLPEEKQALGSAQHCAWETVQRGHAVANGCYLAAINRAGTHDGTEFWGQSFVANPYGELIAKGSIENEEIIFQEISFKQVEDFRRIWPFFRDRRIDAYGELTSRWVGK